METLPSFLLEDILNRLEDAMHIARAQLLLKEFYENGAKVRSVRHIVLDVYHERARNVDLSSFRNGVPGDSQEIQDGEPSPVNLSFKEQSLRILGRKSGLVQLCIEVEEKQQYAEPFSDGRRINWLDELTSRLHELVISAVEHLYFVHLDLNWSKADSSGSLEFRDIYISILLFQGSYVWIKSREPVLPKGVYRRSIRDKQGRVTYKYEPRFKPPRGKGSSESHIFNWIYLGQYDTCYEAEILYRIAAFYFGKGDGRLDLGDGRFFAVPAMSEEDKNLCGTAMAKVDWVKAKAKRVYEDFKASKLAVEGHPRSTSSRPEQGDEEGNMEGDPVMEGQFASTSCIEFNFDNQESLLRLQQQVINDLQKQQLQHQRQISQLQLQNTELQQNFLQQQLQNRELQQTFLQLQLQNRELQKNFLQLQDLISNFPQPQLPPQIQEFDWESVLETSNIDHALSDS